MNKLRLITSFVTLLFIFPLTSWSFVVVFDPDVDKGVIFYDKATNTITANPETGFIEIPGENTFIHAFIEISESDLMAFIEDDHSKTTLIEDDDYPETTPDGIKIFLEALTEFICPAEKNPYNYIEKYALQSNLYNKRQEHLLNDRNKPITVNRETSDSASGKSGKVLKNYKWHPYPTRTRKRDSSPGHLKGEDSTAITNRAATNSLSLEADDIKYDADSGEITISTNAKDSFLPIARGNLVKYIHQRAAGERERPSDFHILYTKEDLANYMVESAGCFNLKEIGFSYKLVGARIKREFLVVWSVSLHEDMYSYNPWRNMLSISLKGSIAKQLTIASDGSCFYDIETGKDHGEEVIEKLNRDFTFLPPHPLANTNVADMRPLSMLLAAAYSPPRNRASKLVAYTESESKARFQSDQGFNSSRTEQKTDHKNTPSVVSPSEISEGYLSESYLTTYHESLSSILVNNNIHLQETSSDTLCFFNAVAMQLPVATADLRGALLNHIQSHQSMIQQLVGYEGDQFNNLVTEIEHGQWGDVGLAPLIAWAFKVRVVVIYFNSLNGQVQTTVYQAEQEGETVTFPESSDIPADLGANDVILVHNGLGHWLAGSVGDPLTYPQQLNNDELLNPMAPFQQMKMKMEMEMEMESGLIAPQVISNPWTISH